MIRLAYYLAGLLFPWWFHRRLGMEAVAEVTRVLGWWKKPCEVKGALRVLIINHCYDQDVGSFFSSGYPADMCSVPAHHFRKLAEFFPPGWGDKLWINSRKGLMRIAFNRTYKYAANPIAQYVVRKYRPDILLTPSDIFYYLRPLYKAFQDMGVKIVVQDKEGTLVDSPMMLNFWHQVLNSYPPMADRYYFWGEVQARYWSLLGVPKAKMQILGQPRSDQLFSTDTSELDQELEKQKASYERTVCYFTFDTDAYVERMPGKGPWLKLRQQTHDALAKLASEFPRCLFIIKCHPQSLELAQIKCEIPTARNILILEGAGYSCDLIKKSDIIIGFQTTALIEAMLTDKPIIYTGWDELSRRISNWLIPFEDSKACLEPASVDDFELTLRELLQLAKPKLSVDAIVSRKHFISRYIVQADGQSSYRILKNMDEWLRTQSDPPPIAAPPSSPSIAPHAMD